MKIQNMKIKYEKEVVKAMQKEFDYKNVWEVPTIKKVTINAGIGKINKEKEKIEELVGYLKDITGQAPVKTKARKAISGFKVREGADVGLKVTLRGKKMWDFLDRLVHIALPRTRDFQGIKLSALGARGNLNLGIKEIVIFPEINPENVRNNFGLQISVSNSANNPIEGEKLFRLLGFPLAENKKKNKSNN